MSVLIQECVARHSPESLLEQLRDETGTILLRTALFDSPPARYSFVTARPFLTFRSFGSRCEIFSAGPAQIQFGNPWHLLDSLMARYELLEEVDLPFPRGGCFGYWGYDLKNFVEPKLPRRAGNDLELPDSHVCFYDSLVVFDHHLGKTWIISTGLDADGSRSEARTEEHLEFWRERMQRAEDERQKAEDGGRKTEGRRQNPVRDIARPTPDVATNLSRVEFVSRVERAQRYIRAGDIYQVNLSQRLSAAWPFSGRDLYHRLNEVSPAPFSAFLDCSTGDGRDRFEIVSSSPEQFLRLSGSHIQTRPIKGTRPRSADPTRDAQLTYELQTSAKEMAELVMITDLLRNDLGKVCEFGSVQVPELVRLERFAQVQHLVSTVEGRLRPDVTHFAAFASCFPGGSVTGAPKIRAMEIIDELEPVSRGPYTGALGYLGFNRESQLSITIRTAICKAGLAHFHAGAGIVADSNPEAEYEETLAKARGILAALELELPISFSPPPASPPTRSRQ
jgi:para-aminobenzoate synthetase component 1